jgi:hypothetical protein
VDKLLTLTGRRHLQQTLHQTSALRQGCTACAISYLHAGCAGCNPETPSLLRLALNPRAAMPALAVRSPYWLHTNCWHQLRALCVRVHCHKAVRLRLSTLLALSAEATGALGCTSRVHGLRALLAGLKRSAVRAVLWPEHNACFVILLAKSVACCIVRSVLQGGAAWVF